MRGERQAGDHPDQRLGDRGKGAIARAERGNEEAGLVGWLVGHWAGSRRPAPGWTAACDIDGAGGESCKLLSRWFYRIEPNSPRRRALTPFCGSGSLLAVGVEPF